MPKVLEGTARELILNIRKFCESEKKSKALLIPLRNVRARTAALAGVSEKTVSRIVKEGQIAATTSSRLVTPGRKRPHPKKIIVDQNDLNFIRQKIHHFYVVNKDMPSVNKLRLELKADINFMGSNTTLRRILKSIGFKFKHPNAKNFPGFNDKPVKRRKPAKKKEPEVTSPITTTIDTSLQDMNNCQNIYLTPQTFTTMHRPPPIHPVATFNMQNVQNMPNMQPHNCEVRML